MNIQEVGVLLSPDGYCRVSIVRRTDGLFCLYQHWLWPPETQRSLGVEPVADRRWSTDFEPRLYDDTDPLPAIYGTFSDAEREAERLIGLATG